jgi:hypothetical protein
MNLRRTDGGIRYLSILNWNIEVNADEDSLRLEVYVCDGQLRGERHYHDEAGVTVASRSRVTA